MVQLLRRAMLNKALDIEAFQFHYGSIITGFFSIVPAAPALFQFHYGSIITAIPNGGKRNKITFQFHYGSIITINKLF